VIRVLFGQFGADRTVEELDEAVEREATAALKCAPGAVAEAKKLIRFVSTHDARRTSMGDNGDTSVFLDRHFPILSPRGPTRL